MLRLVFPKSEAAKPRRIQVGGTGASQPTIEGKGTPAVESGKTQS